jgi:hypothetical protein
MSSEYNEELLKVYIGTPSKVEWYKEAFESFDHRDKSLSWYWNSWAMLGGFWFFLYRKQMKIALIILFVVLILGAILPLNIFIFLYILSSVIIGGFATNLLYKDFKNHKKDIEKMFPDDAKRIGVMSIVAGVNSVALYAGVFAFVSLVLIFVGLYMMSTN